MVQINSSTLLLIGGTESVRAVEPSSKTYFYSLASNKWTEGPSMAEKRGRKVSVFLSLSLSLLVQWNYMWGSEFYRVYSPHLP